MNLYSYENLNQHIRCGQVYRREMLLPFSKALDRDLDTLVKKKLIQKLAAGIYYKPNKSLFGMLPPEDKYLVSCFLREHHFLLYSWNEYNSLGLGLTQLYNRVIVLNRKRHGVFKLGNKEFEFIRTHKKFSKKVTPEFLLVDLVNNLNKLSEDSSEVKERILKNLQSFDKNRLKKISKTYGKIATKRFFKEVNH